MISAIIPVYNADKYVSRCLDSLLEQTCPNWEAVCVDDGSTDGSAAILDAYAAKDRRFHVFHITNHGVSHARNFAMEKAVGEHVMMIDSDDFLHCQTFEICLRVLEKYGTDAVMFTYCKPYRTRMMIRHFLHIPETKPHFPHFEPSDIPVKNVDNIFEWATEYSHPDDIDPRWAVKHCQPWRGMFKFSKIKDIKFIDKVLYEDFAWWSEVMLNLQLVSIINLPLYYYYPNFSGSILSSNQELRIASLQKVIAASEKLYASKASKAQRELWEKHFLTPTKQKLAHKLERRR